MIGSLLKVSKYTQCTKYTENIALQFRALRVAATAHFAGVNCASSRTPKRLAQKVLYTREQLFCLPRSLVNEASLNALPLLPYTCQTERNEYELVSVCPPRLSGVLPSRAKTRLQNPLEKTLCESVTAYYTGGAAMAERLVCSPPTQANRVRSPAGSLPGFSQVGIVPDDAAGRQVSLGGFPFPAPLQSDAAPIITSFHPHRLSGPPYSKPTRHTWGCFPTGLIEKVARLYLPRNSAAHASKMTSLTESKRRPPIDIWYEAGFTTTRRVPTNVQQTYEVWLQIARLGDGLTYDGRADGGRTQRAVPQPVWNLPHNAVANPLQSLGRPISEWARLRQTSRYAIPLCVKAGHDKRSLTKATSRENEALISVKQAKTPQDMTRRDIPQAGMERCRNARSGGNERSPRKPADQRHGPARFPRAGVRERRRRGLSPVRLGGRRELDFTPLYLCPSAIRVSIGYWLPFSVINLRERFAVDWLLNRSALTIVLDTCHTSRRPMLDTMRVTEMSLGQRRNGETGGATDPQEDPHARIREWPGRGLSPDRLGGNRSVRGGDQKWRRRTARPPDLTHSLGKASRCAGRRRQCDSTTAAGPAESTRQGHRREGGRVSLASRRDTPFSRRPALENGGCAAVIGDPYLVASEPPHLHVFNPSLPPCPPRPLLARPPALPGHNFPSHPSALAAPLPCRHLCATSRTNWPGVREGRVV
ncbi:hypothetical protein PR048_030045 [Dryococelus australis]|uniref:Uncharacterized protein n=1 Tax=Dryococelus australis TaxID=614101 RepID=A0ABQ9G8N4_9NEOP|nr:hypothetical protein PR048_030045 [Dryococelus australis]